MVFSRGFIRGFGSVIDISPGRIRRVTAKDTRTDIEKIYGDWVKVGQALQKAAGATNQPEKLHQNGKAKK